MKGILSIASAILLVSAAASTARAQGAQPADSKILLSVNGSGQIETRSFGTGGTFSSFNETGRMESRQNIGKAYLFDVSGQYLLREKFGVGVGVWSAHAKSAVAWSALLPDPVYFGRPITLSDTKSDLAQSTLGVNLMVSWSTPISEHLDLALSGGPTILRVSQDVGRLAVSPSAQSASLSVSSESKTSAAAGNVGLDLNYWLNNRYGAGVMLRYAGGTVNLPSVSGLKAGGFQIGAGIRIRPDAKLAPKQPKPAPAPSVPSSATDQRTPPSSTAPSAQMRTPQAQLPPKYFVNLNASSQPQTHSFGTTTSFSAFNETGQAKSTQNVGRGFVFDVTGGYQMREHLAVGVGVWSANANSAIAWSAAIPDPLFFNRPVSKTGLVSDLKQTTVGVNIQAIWTVPVSERMDVALSAGPTIVHVSQDVGALSVSVNSQSATLAVAKQSATSAKGGNAGVDVTYRVTDRYGVGVFARYAGAEADLPSISSVRVGGLQVGGGIRLKF